MKTLRNNTKSKSKQSKGVGPASRSPVANKNKFSKKGTSPANAQKPATRRGNELGQEASKPRRRPMKKKPRSKKAGPKSERPLTS